VKVAKLATDKIVMHPNGPKCVEFSDGEHSLVSNLLTDNPRRIDPYWVSSTMIVWVIDFTTS